MVWVGVQVENAEVETGTLWAGGHCSGALAELVGLGLGSSSSTALIKWNPAENNGKTFGSTYYRHG